MTLRVAWQQTFITVLVTILVILMAIAAQQMYGPSGIKWLPS